MQKITFERVIRKEEERSYFTLSFDVPENIERMDLYYDYPRHVQTERDGVSYDEERNIVDLALTAANGEYVGASGSDRNHIYISPYESAQGYAPIDIMPGKWEIDVGAYKIAPEGVTVKYRVEFTEKKLRRYMGDTHMHTNGSDGVLSSEQLVTLCREMKLDFAFITDHNNYDGNFCLPRPTDMTVVPGAEWTHYNGHAGFLGVKRPYKNPFCVNTKEQAAALIGEARAKGATIVFNHPFCKPECGWKWGFDLAPFDAIEIWNGPTMLGNENEACLTWWHSQLCEGKHIPVTGGSDFHRPQPLSLPGVPCQCLYAMSRSPEDLLSAIRAGHGYVKMSPDAPDIEATAGSAILGDAVPDSTPVDVCFTGLRDGDVLRIITDRETTEKTTPLGGRTVRLKFTESGVRFVRFEVTRVIRPQFPPLRVLVSNPIYYE